MPFKSAAQRRKLWLSNPDVARKFEQETPKGMILPERIKPKKLAKGAYRGKP